MRELPPHRAEELLGEKVTVPRARAVVGGVMTQWHSDLGAGGLRDAMQRGERNTSSDRAPVTHPYRRFHPWPENGTRTSTT